MKNSERTARTKRNIGNAYLALRRHYPIEQIRITELCRVAHSNRTTFYHYFEDIYHLNEAVEDSILEDCFKNFPYRGLLYTDPERYLNEFDNALEPYREDLRCLAKNREAQQYRKLNQWMIKLAKKADAGSEDDRLLTFVIGGVTELITSNLETNAYSEESARTYITQIVHFLLETCPYK